MVSLVEYFMMPPNVEWYDDGMHDAIMIVTTTTTYTLLYLGRLNNIAKAPPTPAPADLPEVLWPPQPRQNMSLDLSPEPEPLL